MIARLHLLPSRVGSFDLQIEGQKSFEIWLDFHYNNETSGGLRNLYFSFPKGEVPPIPELNVDTNLITEVDDFSIGNSSLSADVQVSHSVPLPTLIKSAIPLALELHEGQIAEAVAPPAISHPIVLNS